jgi:hypothetical protein
MSNTKQIPAEEGRAQATLPWHKPELQRLVVQVGTGIAQQSEVDTIKLPDALN